MYLHQLQPVITLNVHNKQGKNEAQVNGKKTKGCNKFLLT